jgi:hypothetical protein
MAAIDRQAADLGGLVVGPPHWDTAENPRDRELARVLNLLVPEDARETTADAAIDCAPTAAGRARTVVAVGMSFLEQVLDRFTDCGLFGSAQSYFYYDRSRRVWPSEERQRVDRATLDWNTVFSRPTVLIVEFNEARLDHELDWLDAFLDDALTDVK